MVRTKTSPRATCARSLACLGETLANRTHRHERGTAGTVHAKRSVVRVTEVKLGELAVQMLLGNSADTARSYFAAMIASISDAGTTPPCPPAIRVGAMPRCLSAS